MPETILPATPRLYKGILFSVHFKREFGEPNADRPWSCKVLANDPEEAIQKTKIVFPGEKITAIFSESHYDKTPMEDYLIVSGNPDVLRGDHACTVEDLSITVRSFNCLNQPGVNIPLSDPASRILEIEHPQRISYFGRISYLDVMMALERDAKIPNSTLRDSPFYRTAPSTWRNAWDDLHPNGA